MNYRVLKNQFFILVYFPFFSRDNINFVNFSSIIHNIVPKVGRTHVKKSRFLDKDCVTRKK